MNIVAFMFTKNFNSKVNCSFQQNTASLIALDTITANKLLQSARYEFNLYELYARKLRNGVYKQKGTLCDVSFLKVLCEQIHKKFIEEQAMESKTTSLSLDTAQT